MTAGAAMPHFSAAGAVETQFTQNMARRRIIRKMTRGQPGMTKRFGHVDHGASRLTGETKAPIGARYPKSQFRLAIPIGKAA